MGNTSAIAPFDCILDKVGTERERFNGRLSHERGWADGRGTDKALEGVGVEETPPTF